VNEDLLYKLVGSKVRAARERVRPSMSQNALAKKVELTRASIVNIEAGKQRAPLHVLSAIAEVLGTELVALIPRTTELAEAEEPLKLSDEAVKKIEAAANGDPLTRTYLMKFINTATNSQP